MTLAHCRQPHRVLVSRTKVLLIAVHKLVSKAEHSQFAVFNVHNPQSVVVNGHSQLALFETLTLKLAMHGPQSQKVRLKMADRLLSVQFAETPAGSGQSTMHGLLALVQPHPESKVFEAQPPLQDVESNFGHSHSQVVKFAFESLVVIFALVLYLL